MIDERAIREAFATIADDAVSTHSIRSGLAARTRLHRQRRMLLRLAGVGVAAAAGVGVGAQLVDRLTADDVELPYVPGGPGGGWLPVPYRYRPAWLPEGYGQRGLSVIVDGDGAAVVGRTWQPLTGPVGEAPAVSLLVGWHDSMAENVPTRPVRNLRIGELPGTIRGNAKDYGGVYLAWQPPGQPPLMVTVHGEEDDDWHQDIAVRVATSVRPDGRTTHVGPRFGWLPDDLTAAPWLFSLGYQGTSWWQSIKTLTEGQQQLHAAIGVDEPPDRRDDIDPTPVRVRNLDAWRGSTGDRLFLTLPDGVHVRVQLNTVEPRREPSDLIRVVEEMEFGPQPDMSWVGSR